MKIAVPTNDGKSISSHFGRSAAFLVFDVECGRITDSTLRPNNRCHPQEDAACHNDPHQAHEHSHGMIVATLAGCEVVLCRGIGQGAVDALTAQGVSIVFVTETGPAERIVEAYAAGTLQPATSSSCHCGH